MKLSRDYLIAALVLVVLYLMFMRPQESGYASTCGKPCFANNQCGGKKCIKSFWTGRSTCQC